MWPLAFLAILVGLRIALRLGAGTSKRGRAFDTWLVTLAKVSMITGWLGSMLGLAHGPTVAHASALPIVIRGLSESLWCGLFGTAIAVVALAVGHLPTIPDARKP